MDQQVLISSLSSTATNSIPHILRLPNELLDDIFQLVHDDRAAPPPICRRLYAYQRKAFYRCVHIETYQSLELFHDTICTSSTVAGLVSELDIVCEEAAYERDETTVAVVHFSAIIARLKELKALALHGVANGLLRIVLRDSTAPEHLAGLEKLEIYAHVIVAPDDVDAGGWVRQLARFPRLEELVIRQHEVGCFLPHVTAPIPTLPSLIRLDLTGHGFGLWEGPLLRDLAVNLDRLSLNELGEPGAGGGSMFQFLVKTAPRNLRHLSLRDSYNWSQPSLPHAWLHDVLPHFTRLTHLALTRIAFTSDTLLPALRSLNELELLHFGFGTVAPDSVLLELVDGPRRLQHLRRLELEHVVCSRGPTLESKGWKLPPEEQAGYFHVWRGWFPARWPPGCSEKGVEAAVEAARKNGIIVEGSAVETKGWEDAYYFEMSAALLIYGDETGNYSEARDAMGDDVVEEHIARTRWMMGLDDEDEELSSSDASE